MNTRREFLRRSALIAAGVVAADQLELLDRLGWVRRLFPGWTPTLWGDGVHDDTDALQAFFDGRPVDIHPLPLSRGMRAVVGPEPHQRLLSSGVFRTTRAVTLRAGSVLIGSQVRCDHNGAALRVNGPVIVGTTTPATMGRDRAVAAWNVFAHPECRV